MSSQSWETVSNRNEYSDESDWPKKHLHLIFVLGFFNFCHTAAVLRRETNCGCIICLRMNETAEKLLSLIVCSHGLLPVSPLRHQKTTVPDN